MMWGMAVYVFTRSHHEQPRATLPLPAALHAAVAPRLVAPQPQLVLALWFAVAMPETAVASQ